MHISPWIHQWEETIKYCSIYIPYIVSYSSMERSFGICRVYIIMRSTVKSHFKVAVRICHHVFINGKVVWKYGIYLSSSSSMRNLMSFKRRSFNIAWIPLKRGKWFLWFMSYYGRLMENDVALSSEEATKYISLTEWLKNHI